MNASLAILEEVQKENINIQNIAQIVTDISALLSHSSYEISLKRRVFIRNVINPDCKDLCSPMQPMTDKLFGDELPKLVKELKLTNTISNKCKTQQSNRQPRYKPYYNKRGSFLGQGRGNPPQRKVFWKKPHQQK